MGQVSQHLIGISEGKKKTTENEGDKSMTHLKKISKNERHEFPAYK